MKRLFPIFILFIFLLLSLLGPITAEQPSSSRMNKSMFTTNDAPTPPLQPPDGPGGSNYTHQGMRQTRYGFGGREFWIFEPTNPTPQSAPLIVFNHGWSAFYPFYYKAWVEHLVRRGNIVVYPRYQLGLVIGITYVTENAIRSTKQAISILQTGNHVRPELEHFAIVGHSLGGSITAEMAMLAENNNLPVPKAIMPVQPFTLLQNFHDIPASTLMLVIVGEDDTVVGNTSGKCIFTTSDQIPFDRKDYVIQHTDSYGSPALLADHGAPLCIPHSSSLNAMDYYSTWKLFDALIDYAFYGTYEEYCLGNTPEQRFMGLWSDGTPVKELTITDTP